MDRPKARWLIAIGIASAVANMGCALKERTVLVTMAATAGADLSTTSHCLGAQTCRELNPILRPFEDKPLALGLLKMGLTAELMWLVHHLFPDHPRLARIMGLSASGAWGWAAWRNRPQGGTR